MKKLFIIPAIALAISFTSCGGNTTSSSTDNQDNSTQIDETSSNETIPGLEDVTISNTWAIEGNDQMKFNTNLIRVKAGEDVVLTLKNAGTMPKESMGHNLVVLKPAVDLATFGGEAAAAADTEYIPQSSLTSIIAHTKLLGPGEQDKITFKLDKGTYDYICSFPGHYGVMHGKIVAE